MEKLKEYLKEELNTEQLKEMARSVNSYNGGLDWLEYWENDEDFFNTMYQNNPMEAARAVCYGEYNFTDEYVKINAYGNLTSVNEWEYEEEIKSYKEEIIDAYVDLYEENENYLQYDEAYKIIETYKEENEEGEVNQ